MSGSSLLESIDADVVYDEHYDVEEAYVMSVGIEPKGQDPFVHHHSLHH